jgi:hypothetical protein
MYKEKIKARFIHYPLFSIHYSENPRLSLYADQFQEFTLTYLK